MFLQSYSLKRLGAGACSCECENKKGIGRNWVFWPMNNMVKFEINVSLKKPSDWYGTFAGILCFVNSY